MFSALTVILMPELIRLPYTNRGLVKFKTI